MSKRIVGFIPIGDGSKDRGEKITVFELLPECINEIETNAFGIKKGIIKEIPCKDIIYIDCFKGSELRNESASSAVAGGILFGLSGAILGGIIGLNQNSWYCKIQTLAKTIFFRLNSELDKNHINKWAEKQNIHLGCTEKNSQIFGFENGMELEKLKQENTDEIEDPLDTPIEVDITSINNRLSVLGSIATSEFYRLKKHIEYFTEADILRLEAMERSSNFKK